MVPPHLPPYYPVVRYELVPFIYIVPDARIHSLSLHSNLSALPSDVCCHVVHHASKPVADGVRGLLFSSAHFLDSRFPLPASLSPDSRWLIHVFRHQDGTSDPHSSFSSVLFFQLSSSPTSTYNQFTLFCCNPSRRASVRIAFQSSADCLLGSFLHLPQWLASASILPVSLTLPRLRQLARKVVAACYSAFFFFFG